MIVVHLQIRLCAQQRLHKLIGRLEIVEAVQRSSVLYPGIVRVKGDNVLDTHILKLLKGESAVQGFPAGAAVLPAFVKEGHDHVDAVGLSGGGGNHTLQVLIMIVRRHMVFMAADRISQAVIADIYHNKEIASADRFAQTALASPVPKRGQEQSIR